MRFPYNLQKATVKVFGLVHRSVFSKAVPAILEDVVAVESLTLETKYVQPVAGDEAPVLP